MIDFLTRDHGMKWSALLRPLAMLVVVHVAADLARASGIAWQGGTGVASDANWNVGGAANQNLPAPIDNNAVHTLGYQADDLIITALGSNLTFNDRVALSAGSITITDSTVDFAPTIDGSNISGLNLGHDGNAMAGDPTVGTFTNSDVFVQRANIGGNGMRLANGSSLSLSGGSLTVRSESRTIDETIALEIQDGSSSLSLFDSAQLQSGYIDFGGGGGSITLDSGAITLLSNDPFRGVTNGVVNFTGGGSASIVNTNNTGSGTTLASRLAAGLFSINGITVFDTNTAVGEASFQLSTNGATDTLSLVSTSSLKLEVYTDTGFVRIVNDLGQSVELDAYVIQSADVENDGGSLDHAAWVSLEDLDLPAFPAGAGGGDGWEEGGNPSDVVVNESFLLGSSTLADTRSLMLGNLFDDADTQDLSFHYHVTGQASTTEGIVQYFSETPLFGDFNGDHVVDSADYTVWRDSVGAVEDGAVLNGLGDGGTVDVSDYELWRANYGRSTSAAAAVPEPTAAWMALIGALVVCGIRLRRTAALLCVAMIGSIGGESVAQQPNIVFVMADDLGWADTSNTLTTDGDPSDFYETPALDRIASEGMAFTNAYASQNCAPTRAAILSGAYAPRPTNNVYQVGDLNRNGGETTLLVGPSQGLPTGTDAIPTTTITHAETLQSAGYTTAYVGKFHVTEVGAVGEAQIVSDHGFDFNFGGATTGAPGGTYFASGGQFNGSISAGLDPYAANYTQSYVDTNIKPFAVNTSTAAIDALVGTAKHLTDASADAVIDFVNNNSSDPFFVQYSPHAVHTPIGANQARDDLLNKYQNKPNGSEDSNAAYAALIEGLDQSLARIVDHLENTADPRNPGQMLADNTVLVFYSDNGGRQPQANNGGLKNQKGELDEGGIRVPMVAWSANPNLIDGASVNDTPVVPVDFYKTFASLGGATLPVSQDLDGEDLSPLFADASADLGRESVYWHLPGYLINNGGRNQRPQTVVRSGDWKLLYSYEDQSYELYNLSTDLGETSNVADENDAVVDQLSDDIVDWLDEVDAPLATLRSGTLELTITGRAYANGVATDYAFETVTISAGEEVPFVVDATPDLADTNMDGVVNAADWNAFKAGQFLDMTGLTLLESFQLGDIDHDLDNDLDDFIAFRQAYDQALGAGSFQSLLSVPEPSAMLLVGLGCLSLATSNRSRGH